MKLATIETRPDLGRCERQIDGLKAGSRTFIESDAGFWQA
jgi:hypothetical protein